MSKERMYWGLGILILLIIGGTVFLVAKHQAEIRERKEQLADVTHQQVSEVELPKAKEGFKWVRHGDHYHEVPLDAPDEWQDAPHTRVQQVLPSDPAPVRQYKGSLTYHKELLETHPVEALRQQAQETGHWSADHIPPFPPDDTEASDFARELYLYRYYKWTGQTDTPAYLKSAVAQHKIFQAICDREDQNPYAHARSNDLLKLTWPDTTISPRTTRFTTTFTEGINPITARPLLTKKSGVDWIKKGSTQ